MTFSTYLMGAQSLLIQCAELLLGRGHEIRGVITDHPDIERWASSHRIPVLAPGAGLDARITESFDWFLSIANLRIVPDAVLAKAKLGAVNFHDGPLPRYAGVNAPNWALLAGETKHGVTWHKIEGGIDEGNILAQRFFEVAPLATALEINRSCYEAAIESFPEVLDALESGDASGQAQDLSQRTYVARDDRPDALALIDWSRDAEDVVRLVRALDFGRTYPNPMQLAKLAVQGRARVVIRADVSAGEGTPGQVLEASPEGALIACGRGAVRVLELRDQDGEPVCPSTLAGHTLDAIDASGRSTLSEQNKTWAKYDGFWAKRLEKLNTIDLPQLGAPTETARVTALEYPCDAEGTRWLAGVTAFLSRIGGKSVLHVGYQPAALSEAIGDFAEFWSPVVPLRVDASGTVGASIAWLDKEVARVEKRGTFARDLVCRRPQASTGRFAVVVAPEAKGAVDGAGVTIARGQMFVDIERLPIDEAKQLAKRLGVLLAALQHETPIAQLPLLTDAERREVLFERNATEVEYTPECMHTLIERQVDATPDLVAVRCEGASITYRELDQAANRVAHVLRDRGIRPDDLVGLYCHRSLELVVGALGILKAGAAYLPLDPDYPEERITLYLEDSRAKMVITHAEAQPGLRTDAEVLVLDTDARIGAASTERATNIAAPNDLAYVIYTSGSTGRPKGVMVEHRNVANFFVGMDERVPRHTDHQPVWLAVTSLSFDISVLELFWTLARGFQVVVHRERERLQPGADPAIQGRPMGYGLFYWGNDDGQGPKKYELLLEGAKLGDRIGFTSIWTPERHFHAFGGPYPNPSVTGAAVAAVTKNLEIRAGSCVAPLHHPARIAEEWAVIDNLSNGRTGLAFASGWQPEDFVLRPENTPPKNKDAMFETMDVVRRLWRGEAVEFAKEDGTMMPVVTQPRPVSPELRVWVTTAGNPKTYEKAGEIGANILTHLLGQSIEEVAEKIVIYRNALKKHGHDPDAHTVTLMLHTHLEETREKAREVSREPMKDYLRSAAGLIKQYAWAFPAFKKPEGVSNPFQLDLGALADEEMEAILDFAFTRYFEDSGLFGTIDDAVARVNKLKAVGVDEIGCLIDYGIETPAVLESLKRVGEVIRRTNRPAEAPAEDYSAPAQIERHSVTHLQCTPSMARFLTLDERARGAMAALKQILIGGEALPGALVKEMGQLTSAPIENMYGPTETTIWSSTQGAEPSDGITPIGTPIANTQLYVLDAHHQPVPVGVPGELYIGGDGVTRGYLFRDELTRERFPADPFRGNGARMYRTGDLVRWRTDGRLDFIGRVDHQVKLRGYRIELGEIESRLNALNDVREAVVIAREDVPGDKRLVAYLTVHAEVDEAALRAHLSESLPEYMVPSHFVTLDAFPLTPNAKVDRKKLPKPDDVQSKSAAEYVAPENETEQKIAEVWKKVLGVKRVGSKDNFFELGGHSLLAVQAHRELKAALGSSSLAITDIFRFPTLGALAEHVGGSGEGAKVLSKAAERAAKRRAARRRGS